MRTGNLRSAICGILAVVLGAWGSLATAGGLYLTEVGSPISVGMAGAGNVTNNFGADSAWTNPAGMTGLAHDTMETGLTFLFPKVEFESTVAEAGGDDGGQQGTFAAIPSIFYVKPLSEKSAFGFSLVAPLGGGFDPSEDWVGRYAMTELALQGVGITPSYAYQVNDRLSLGIGASFTYTIMDMDIAFNRNPTGTGPVPDGLVRFEELDDWGVQGILGLQYQMSDSTLLGVVYRSEFDADLDGDLRTQGMPILGPMFPSQAKISWTFPQLFEVGIQHKLSDRSAIFVNADWEEWSAFSENLFQLSDGSGGDPLLAVLNRAFDDTWHLGFGYSSRHEDFAWTVGIGYDSSPVDDADRTLDLMVDEQWRLGAFVGSPQEYKSGVLDWGVSIELMFLGDNKVDQTIQRVRTVGEYDTGVIIFVAGTVRYRF